MAVSKSFPNSLSFTVDNQLSAVDHPITKSAGQLVCRPTAAHHALFRTYRQCPNAGSGTLCLASRSVSAPSGCEFDVNGEPIPGKGSMPISCTWMP